jgi:hypothetical protein
MLNELTANETDRFWAKVAQKGEAECWEWTGCNINGGYGRFGVAGAMQLAHRVSWFIAHGPIPYSEGYHGTCVLHRCDNTSCVNPDHLFLGTNQDNVDDMVAKGRDNKAKGSAHGVAVLTEEDVRRIRKIGRAVTQQVLADQFGVDRSHIGKILRRKSWRHLDD